MQELMTSTEVALYLRVHVRTIYHWARTGQMPSRRVGGSWRFKKADLDSWLSETNFSASRGKRVQRPEKRIGPESPKVYEGEGQSSL